MGVYFRMLVINIHTYLRILFGRPQAFNFIIVVYLSMFLSSKHIAGVEVKLHTFLTSAIGGGEWLVTFTHQLLYPWGKNAQFCGPQRLSECFGEEKRLLPMLGLKPQICRPYV